MIIVSLVKRLSLEFSGMVCCHNGTPCMKSVTGMIVLCHYEGVLGAPLMVQDKVQNLALSKARPRTMAHTGLLCDNTKINNRKKQDPTYVGRASRAGNTTIHHAGDIPIPTTTIILAIN